MRWSVLLHRLWEDYSANHETGNRTDSYAYERIFAVYISLREIKYRRFLTSVILVTVQFVLESKRGKMSGADLARKILRNLTVGQNAGGSPAVRKDYVEHLTNRSLAFLKSYDRGFGILSESDIVRDAALRMVERVFGLLEPYVVHFNEAVDATQLCIASTAPDEILETVEGEWPFRPSQEKSFYRARFSTHNLSLVIRGSEDRVEFFILPVEQVMRMSQIEDQYGALMTFHARLVEGKVEWEVEEKPLTDERFERYCLLTFDYFVKETTQNLMQAS